MGDLIFFGSAFLEYKSHYFLPSADKFFQILPVVYEQFGVNFTDLIFYPARRQVKMLRSNNRRCRALIAVRPGFLTSVLL